MSFKISCSPHLAREGRSGLSNNLQFAPHPRSSFEKLANGCTADLSPSSSPNDGSPIHALEVIEYLAPGYLWDFWLAQHPIYGKVVLKLVLTSNYSCCRPEYDDYIPQNEIFEEALKQEEFYLGPLADLQGDIVPKYHGLYTSVEGGWYIAIMLEWAGYALGPRVIYLKEEWLQKVYEAYETLHLHGVMHSDLCTRHILVDDNHKIRLVSFRQSARKYLTDEDDVSVLMCEAVKLRVRIGMERIKDVDR
ncbi:hypothetical protein I302_100663 [Kwoniella bestiolae CBS 10118]|uniref:Protein kinase domain-containing protein n=1 Tax=Kwoniella bestiolae CBS 10118 TaxID=1296100 RepID=A0A1B9G5Q0_9TREE|nr:hypothetical protein I302_04038 [Kwoniella bestiolae CBS 10118]OCF26355.1 hypothetical protein I302_04038 [Kwoniella bestiolae CBS 10118]